MSDPDGPDSGFSGRGFEAAGAMELKETIWLVMFDDELPWELSCWKNVASGVSGLSGFELLLDHAVGGASG
jgi:hypothetical protein